VPVPHGPDGSRTRAVLDFFQPTGRTVDGTVSARPQPSKVRPSTGIRRLDGYQISECSQALKLDHRPVAFKIFTQLVNTADFLVLSIGFAFPRSPSDVTSNTDEGLCITLADVNTLPYTTPPCPIFSCWIVPLTVRLTLTLWLIYEPTSILGYHI